MVVENEWNVKNESDPFVFSNEEPAPFRDQHITVFDDGVPHVTFMDEEGTKGRVDLF